MGFDRNFSYYLFARPTFLEGLARTIDIGAGLDEYNVSLTDEEADSIALYTDWKNVGDDIESAIVEYGEEIQREAVA